MTSKLIIIDGVDVSECEFYQIEANELYPKAQYCGSMRNTFCENEPNCYFKQLQRKIQECKEKVLQMAECEVELEKYQNALEEIRQIATKDVNIESLAKIQLKINDVLENNIK